MSKKYLLGMVLALFLFASCSLSIEQEALARSIELPDLALTNATYVLDRGEDYPLYIVAQYIALYDQTHKAQATAVTFTQHDAQGKLVLQGSADEATVDLQSYDAQLRGAVIVEKFEEQLLIEAQELRWMHEEQLLASEGQAEVVITYEGNKRIRGTGLRFELATANVAFEQVLEGVVIP